MGRAIRLHAANQDTPDDHQDTDLDTNLDTKKRERR